MDKNFKIYILDKKANIYNFYFLKKGSIMCKTIGLF
jgi:hypothetical protein